MGGEDLGRASAGFANIQASPQIKDGCVGCCCSPRLDPRDDILGAGEEIKRVQADNRSHLPVRYLELVVEDAQMQRLSKSPLRSIIAGALATLNTDKVTDPLTTPPVPSYLVSGSRRQGNI